MKGRLCGFGAAAFCVSLLAENARISPRTPPDPGLAGAVLTALCRADASGLECTACPGPVDFGLAAPWTIHAIRRGSFAGAGRDELAVDGTGCAPHSTQWGGTLPLERSGGGWRTLRYEPGLRTDDCAVVRGPGGRDLLLCTEVGGGQGGAGMKVKLVTLDHPRQVRVLLLGVDTRALCGAQIGDPERRLVRAQGFEFESFTWRAPVLRVVTKEGGRTPTEAERQACIAGPRLLDMPLRRVERVYWVP